MNLEGLRKDDLRAQQDQFMCIETYPKYCNPQSRERCYQQGVHEWGAHGGTKRIREILERKT